MSPRERYDALRRSFRQQAEPCHRVRRSRLCQGHHSRRILDFPARPASRLGSSPGGLAPPRYVFMSDISRPSRPSGLCDRGSDDACRVIKCSGSPDARPVVCQSNRNGEPRRQQRVRLLQLHGAVTGVAAVVALPAHYRVDRWAGRCRLTRRARITERTIGGA